VKALRGDPPKNSLKMALFRDIFGGKKKKYFRITGIKEKYLLLHSCFRMSEVGVNLYRSIF